MSSHDKSLVPAEPVVDEWGIYDPDRAGLAALFERLEAKHPPLSTADDARAMAISMRQAATLRVRD